MQRIGSISVAGRSTAEGWSPQPGTAARSRALLGALGGPFSLRFFMFHHISQRTHFLASVAVKTFIVTVGFFNIPRIFFLLFDRVDKTSTSATLHV